MRLTICVALACAVLVGCSDPIVGTWVRDAGRWVAADPMTGDDVTSCDAVDRLQVDGDLTGSATFFGNCGRESRWAVHGRVDVGGGAYVLEFESGDSQLVAACELENGESELVCNIERGHSYVFGHKKFQRGE